MTPHALVMGATYAILVPLYVVVAHHMFYEDSNVRYGWNFREPGRWAAFAALFLPISGVGYLAGSAAYRLFGCP